MNAILSPLRRALQAGAVLAAFALPAAAGGSGPLTVAAAPGGAGGTAAACPAVLDHSFPRLQDDAPQHLCRYAGKVLLIVNTASKCGFTKQYEALEKLHDRYASKGLVVLGFPSNDFGNQEPGSNREIAEFCENTFGVRFPMLAKTHVTGPDANPVFAALAQASGSPPRWNFHKYLVGRDGQLVAAHPSKTSPLDPGLLRQIDAALAAGAAR